MKELTICMDKPDVDHWGLASYFPIYIIDVIQIYPNPYAIGGIQWHHRNNGTIIFLPIMLHVAVSCGYDTWFAVRLVMDYTTSHFTWSILGYLSIPLARHTGVQVPLVPAKVITCQSILVPSISCLRVYMGCALALIFQVRSLYVPCYMVHFQGSISGSP